MTKISKKSVLSNETTKPIPLQVQEFACRIANLISIEEIYFNHFKYQDVDFKELIILIPKTSRLHIMEARPLMFRMG
ncbi:hypothetical protein ABIE26_004424 [Pedobacter africanus]|uniref:Uncharacterized protein n=1 Tax=Pedobacter africanus TaxID=151894 RepID=A0ACC6L431_9SPHI|nr:hypothetical protein [Pedobacter africanus]